MYEKIKSIVDGLSSVEKDALYRCLWVDHVREDVISYCEDNDIAYTDENFLTRLPIVMSMTVIMSVTFLTGTIFGTLSLRKGTKRTTSLGIKLRKEH